MMKKRLGMQKELDMAPIPKVMVSVGQFRPAREFGKSICVLCLKDGDAKNEFGDGMTGLCVHDSGIAANLNRKKGQRNDDANRADTWEIAAMASQFIVLSRSRLTRISSATADENALCYGFQC